MRKTVFALVFTAVVFGFGVAGARADTESETVTFSGTLNFQSCCGNPSSESFAEFNPSLGTLTSVTFIASGTASDYAQNGGLGIVFFSPANDYPGGDLGSFGAGARTFSIDQPSTSAAILAALTGTGDTTLTMTDGAPSDVDSITVNSAEVIYTYTPAVAATPEPSGLALLGTGVLAVAGAVRRRLMVR
jgi:PEP-CTERM motif